MIHGKLVIIGYATSFPCFTDNLDSGPEYVDQCGAYDCCQGASPCNCAQYELICCKLNNNN